MLRRKFVEPERGGLFFVVPFVPFVLSLCAPDHLSAHLAGVRLMIDAEQSWLQPAIDNEVYSLQVSRGLHPPVAVEPVAVEARQAYFWDLSGSTGTVYMRTESASKALAYVHRRTIRVYAAAQFQLVFRPRPGQTSESTQASRGK